jgi:cold shock CspA family protein
MAVMQGTVATFDPDTRGGTLLLDNGFRLSFNADAFARSGLRFLRLGQRVKLRVVDGTVVALAHIAMPLE